VGLEAGEDLVGLPLGPQEVVLVPLFEVSHRPPEPLLHASPHQDRVVPLPNVIFVGRDAGFGEGDLDGVGLVDLVEELLVVLLLELLVLLLVLWVRQVLRQLLYLIAELVQGGDGAYP